MYVLVTGADGFVARHLIPLLRGQGHEVVGTALRPERVPQGIQAIPLDVIQAAACRSVLASFRPTHVVHLAAVSSVRWSFDHPAETRAVNVQGTQNVLAAALALEPISRVLIVGSSEEYGTNDGRPLPELPVASLHPLSPYAESKVAVERLIEDEPHFRACTIRTRSFPHFGPGQQAGFFTADVARQLARIALGETPPVLHVGNLDAVRDYTDVRDVVRAYLLLLERGVLGDVYNVSSGSGVAIRALLERFVQLAGVGDVAVVRDAERERPSDIPVLVGDSSKLRAITGWAPTIPLEQSLRDVLAWWHTQPAVALDAVLH